jgi:hypothetical protein
MRIAFVNTATTPATIQIKTQEAVECCQLLMTTPASQPAQNPGRTQPAGAWQLAMPPGTIFGFVAEHAVEVLNPNSGSVITVYADSKEPWPQPPPLVSDVPDFATRYQNFLMVAGLPDSQHRPIALTIARALE